MIDRLAALIVDEGEWLTASMGCALLAVAVLLYRHRRSDVPARRRVLAAMNLFLGVVNVGLFIGSVMLLASGQSFEQFRRMPT